MTNACFCTEYNYSNLKKATIYYKPIFCQPKINHIAVFLFKAKKEANIYTENKESEKISKKRPPLLGQPFRII
jgi:hypothetical protein